MPFRQVVRHSTLTAVFVGSNPTRAVLTSNLTKKFVCDIVFTVKQNSLQLCR